MLTEFLWRKLMVRLVKGGNVLQALRAPQDRDYVKPMAIRKRYPGLGDCPIYMSEETPLSERASTLNLLVLEIALRFKERFGLTRSYPAPYELNGSIYPREFSALLPEPLVPEDFAADADRLAGLASRGPFSILTRRDGDGYVIDLRHIERLTPRAPFVRAGGLARFARGPENSLVTRNLEFDGQSISPDALNAWRLAEKRFLVGLNTHTTVFEHLLNLHLFAGGTWAICTFLALSPRHPLRVLLHPFIVETMRVNNDQIEGLLLSEASNIPSYSGYPLTTVNAAFQQMARAFDVRQLDPEWRAREQGQLGDPLFPTVGSLIDVWRIFRGFASRWCDSFVKPGDVQARIWAEELDHKLPNGVRRLIGQGSWDELTSEHVAHLAAIGMFAASIGHHVVNDLVAPYFLQFDVMPSAVDKDGNPTLGIVYEKRNSVFIASIKRYMLVSPVAFSDPVMTALWRSFQAELIEYEQDSPGVPADTRYRVAPTQAARSIHA